MGARGRGAGNPSVSTAWRSVSLPMVQSRSVSVVSFGRTSVWLVWAAKPVRSTLQEFALPLAISTIKISFPLTLAVAVSITFPIPLLSFPFSITFPKLHHAFPITISVPFAVSFTVTVPPSISRTTSTAEGVAVIQVWHAAAPASTSNWSITRVMGDKRRAIGWYRRGG